MPHHFAHPSSARHFKGRNRLLQTTLRPQELWNGAPPFAIEDEYPIVLSENNSRYSYCLFDEQDFLVSHANLWPRSVITWCNATNSSGIGTSCAGLASTLGQIGLIGNVATHPSHQGLGYSSKLLAHLEKVAIEMNLKALVLWSDLTSFYQKQGYRSLGWEWRYEAPEAGRLKTAPALALSGCRIQLVTDYTQVNLEYLQSLRPRSGPTLERSTEDFARLLSIPATELFTFKPDGLTAASSHEILGYGIVGKGADMAGYVHEWGVTKETYLVPMLARIIAATGYARLGIMIPDQASCHYRELLGEAGYTGERFPMALGKRLDSNAEHMTPDTATQVIAGLNSGDCLDALGSGFIWGLDSI